MQALKEKSILWTHMWRANGCPSNGIVRDIMISAKKAYKREARYNRRNQERLISESIAKRLRSANRSRFWQLVKGKNVKTRSVPTVIDGKHGDSEILNVFKEKYSCLFNSVASRKEDIGNLNQLFLSDIRKKCETGSCLSSHVITVEEVRSAVKKLKVDKSDANPQVLSDHFIKSCNELHVHLSHLFCLMLSHGHAPCVMLHSVIVPILKDPRKSVTYSDNYRSICLSSVIGKIFDNIVLKSQNEVLRSNNLQFGFKANHSTTQCTFVLNEIIEYFVSRGSSCYVVLLDASKAFDRVSYSKLFELLRARGICPSIAKLMLNMYTNQKLKVRWNNSNSESFVCSNGVKQGAVLSPILFNVYMDELLKRLKDSKIGCHIGHHYAGALSYADDLTLIAPSVTAVKKMLRICEEFSAEYNVTFNSSKSKLLTFGNSSGAVDIKLENNPIEHVKGALHLGSYIGQESSLQNIERASREIRSKTNMILSRFKLCNTVVRNELFNVHCRSFYGAPLWNLSKKHMNVLCTSWRKCEKCIWRLDPLTRSWVIPHITGNAPIRNQLFTRCLKFLITCMNSSNSFLSFITKSCLISNSVSANNFRTILCEYNINPSDLPNIDVSKVKTSPSRLCKTLTDEELSIVSLAKDLICIADNDLCSVISRSEACVILRTVVT